MANPEPSEDAMRSMRGRLILFPVLALAPPALPARGARPATAERDVRDRPVSGPARRLRQGVPDGGGIRGQVGGRPGRTSHRGDESRGCG